MARIPVIALAAFGLSAVSPACTARPSVLSSERHEKGAGMNDCMHKFVRLFLAGLAVTIEQYDQAHAQVARCRAQLADVFQDVDVLLAPSAPGAAPLGLDNTGDPVFCRIWTVLHTPTVNIPAGFAPNGMPVGLQVVGSVGADGMTLAAAHVLQECFGVSPA